MTHSISNTFYSYHLYQYYQWIFTKQNKMDESLKRKQKFPDQHCFLFDDNELICCIAPGDDNDTQWKIALINSTILPTLHWFHTMLGHPGTQHMSALLQARYHHLYLCMHIE